MSQLLQWRESLQKQYHNPAFIVPVPTLNLGHIHGGDNPNRICGECELQIDLRPLPGMSLQMLREQLRFEVETALSDTDLHAEVTPLFNGVEAMETAAVSPLVTHLEQLTGHAAEAVAFATEGPYLNHLGMDTVILGPGHIEQAHQPDEFLELNTVQPMLNILTHLIQQFCVEPHEPIHINR